VKGAHEEEEMSKIMAREEVLKQNGSVVQ